MLFTKCLEFSVLQDKLAACLIITMGVLTDKAESMPPNIIQNPAIIIFVFLSKRPLRYLLARLPTRPPSA